jgi:TatD DNase family protein
MTVAYEYRPGVLYLNVTNRCSNDCSFCVRRGPDFSLAGYDMRLGREPSPAEALAAVERLEQERAGPFDEVVFCGFGEPTYRLDTIGLVGRALRARNVPVRLNTNGQAALIHGLDPWNALAEAIDSVSVSLNAPDEETYQALCHSRFGADAFGAVLEFIRVAVRRLSTVGVTVVGSSLEHDSILRCAALAADLGASFRVR